MDTPDFIIIGAFRYAMGRKTFMPSMVCKWLRANWADFNERTRMVIARDLKSEIEMDDRVRKMAEENKGKIYGLPLGHDCDRAEWLMTMEFINEKEAFETH